MPKRLLCLLFVCLSACQSPVAETPRATPTPAVSAVLPVGKPGLFQQEIAFDLMYQTGFRLQLTPQGDGLLVTGGRPASEPLRVQTLRQYVLEGPLRTYPSLVHDQLAAHTLFLNAQGRGQVLTFTSDTRITAGYSPPQNRPLEIHALDISDFQPAAEARRLSFGDAFSTLMLNQCVVDENGNGYLSLTVRRTPSPDAQSDSPAPWQIVFVSIREHQLQNQLETPVEWGALAQEQGTQVWLNAAQTGLVLTPTPNGQWGVYTLTKGQLSPEPTLLGNVRESARAEYALDATGQGYVALVAFDQTRQVYPIRDFRLGTPQTYRFPEIGRESQVFSTFTGDQGMVLELPFQAPQTRQDLLLNTYQLAAGEIRSQRQLRVPLRDHGFQTGVSWALNTAGHGLLAFGTAQGGGAWGKIHLQAIEDFQLAGPERWELTPSAP